MNVFRRFPPYTPLTKSVVNMLSHPTVDWINGQVERPAVQRLFLLLIGYLVAKRFVKVSFL